VLSDGMVFKQVLLQGAYIKVNVYYTMLSNCCIIHMLMVAGLLIFQRCTDATASWSKFLQNQEWLI